MIHRFCHLCKCETPWWIKTGAHLPNGWLLYVCTMCCKAGVAYPMARTVDLQTHHTLDTTVDFADYGEDFELILN